MAQRNSYHRAHVLLTLALCFLIQTTTAQIGTTTQDITTISAFPLQKACAKSCFVRTGYCPNDVLGSEIGCATPTGCDREGWQATNDCYCRADLQTAAQSSLTSCISYYCSVGDFSIDAASAGSIYSQYCAEKGYTASAVPATVSAQPTGTGGVAKTTTGGGIALPTSSISSESSSSKSNGLSITQIIGIVVGCLAALAFLAVVLKILLRYCSCLRKKPVQYSQSMHPLIQQPPVYPPQYPPSYYQAPMFPQPSPDGELEPDDSVSVVLERPAPTLISAVPGYPPKHR